MATDLLTDLREKRLARGLSIRELSRIIGCDAATIWAWENGEWNPSGTHYAAIQEWIKSVEFSQRSVEFSQRPYRTTHPANDPYFMLAVGHFEACMISRGGKCECPVKHECLKLYNRLSELCSDKPLTAEGLIKFLDNFTLLRNGNGDKKK